MIQEVDTSYGSTRVYRNASPGADKHILIVPGHSESITHNRELIDRLAGRGYDAFTFNQPQRGTFTDPIIRQQTIILEILFASIPTSKKVHVVTHSLGAVATLRAAIKNPERFDSLVLMQPSGIGDKQTFFQLIARVGKKTAKNHSDAVKQNTTINGSEVYTAALSQVIRAHTASTSHIARNPLLALKEANAAVQYTITDDIATVQKLGIPVNIVFVHDDELFSMKKPLEYDEVMKLPGSYTSLVNRDARHDTFWMHPEQTTELIDAYIKNNRI